MKENKKYQLSFNEEQKQRLEEAKEKEYIVVGGDVIDPYALELERVFG